MKKYLIIFFCLISCSSNKKFIKNDFKDLSFSDDYTFEEFKIKLNEYSKNKSYPNIDN